MDTLRVAFPGRAGLSMAAAQEELNAVVGPADVVGTHWHMDHSISPELLDNSARPVAHVCDGGATPPPASMLAGPTLKKSLVGQHMANQVNWAELSSGRETRTTLRLRGLSKSICSSGTLQRALVQGDLLHAVDFIRCFPGSGSKLGSAIINVTACDRVPSVVKFFHGRQFGSSPPVAVSFCPVQGLDALRAAYPEPRRPGRTLKMPAKVPLRNWLDERVPKVFATDAAVMGCDAASDASTEEPLSSASESGACTGLDDKPLRIILPPPGLTCGAAMISA